MAGHPAAPRSERLAAYLLDPGLAFPATDEAAQSDRVAADRVAADRVAADLGAWLKSLPRFLSFADANREKIRKKLRLARVPDARLDVRAELLVARLLLADPGIELGFEPGGTRGGPDFAVTHRKGRPFNLEVTRPRHLPGAAESARPIIAKLHQLPTGAANILVLAVAGAAATWDVPAAVRAVRARADAKDEDWFTRRGFAGTRDFYERFLRLSAVIAWREGSGAEVWTNGSARIPVPERSLRACLLALR